jgi:hypothetical protein
MFPNHCKIVLIQHISLTSIILHSIMFKFLSQLLLFQLLFIFILQDWDLYFLENDLLLFEFGS